MQAEGFDRLVWQQCLELFADVCFVSESLVVLDLIEFFAFLSQVEKISKLGKLSSLSVL